MDSPATKLRRLLEKPGLRVMPCCFDALSAKLIERAGFELTFMSGFAVSATKLGAPDTGLISYGEMVEQGRQICAAVSLPVIGVAALVGLVVAALQAVTQLQDSTIAHLPRLLAVAVALALTAPWMGSELAGFAIEAFTVR